jgi:acetyl-CoA carboxylase biotin carboxyl carrier protein
MDLKLIKNLLTMISDSDVNEVSIEEGDFKIKIKKQSDQPAAREQVYYAPPAQQAAPAPAQAPAASSSAPAQEAKPAASNGLTIKSPIVGTYYSKPSPDASPYIKVGDVVKKGQVLCIVEAMKIMNEIESEHDGKILEIHVQDSQPVEFDQPLFTIESA